MKLRALPNRTVPTATANLMDTRARHLMLIVRGDAATCSSFRRSERS